jgi:RimJ/RimL family protein N-acetyltransferase
VHIPELRTERLRLRAWRDDDLAPFAALNADPAVMRHFPALLTRAESDAAAGRIRASFAERGLGLWAVEVPGQAAFIGAIGLAVPRFEAHFTPCVEIAWRLARAHHGHGYATEGARAALAFGFTRLGLDEIVSFTALDNHASRRVMEKLGMRHAGDFDHPLLPAGHRLQRHVLYRLSRAAWLAARIDAPPGTTPDATPGTTPDARIDAGPGPRAR